VLLLSSVTKETRPARRLPNFSVTRPNASARLAAIEARLAAADASLAVERAQTEKRLPHRTVHGRDQQ
jgi:hypothetical protein